MRQMSSSFLPSGEYSNVALAVELAAMLTFCFLEKSTLSVAGSTICKVRVVEISLSVVFATLVAMVALSPLRTKRGMLGMTIIFLLATHSPSIIP